MPQLQRLAAEHAEALLAFETDNRAYFAAAVPDRGDAFFTEFDERLKALLDEQDTGTIHMHVLVEPDGAVIGRVNLVDVADGAAELGYRIAQAATGRGIATTAVTEALRLARDDYGLTRIDARTTPDNLASRKVLDHCGFTFLGERVIDGEVFVCYERALATSPST